MNREELKKRERDLWVAADKLRAHADVKAAKIARSTNVY